MLGGSDIMFGGWDRNIVLGDGTGTLCLEAVTLAKYLEVGTWALCLEIGTGT